MVKRNFLPAYYVNAGSKVTFCVNVEDRGLGYRWRLNGREIADERGGALALTNVGATAGGTYSVVVSNGGGEAIADLATLTVVSDASLSDFSVCGRAGTAEHALLLGFVIDGAGSKEVLLRGVRSDSPPGGMGVSPYKPEVTLLDWSGGVLLAGDAWESDGALASAYARFGASLPPAASAHSAAIVRLDTGTYAVRMTGLNGAGGAVRAEIFGGGVPASTLVNGSGRAWVEGDSSPLDIAFTVAGNTSGTVLIRGVGPSLGGLVAPGEALARTELRLRHMDGKPIASSTGWGGDAVLADAFARAGAFALDPAAGDSALLATLPPGRYSASLTGACGAAGIGLVEVYSVPAE